MSENRTICWRYQEVRGDRLVFSCECAGERCPDRPLEFFRCSLPIGHDGPCKR